MAILMRPNDPWSGAIAAAAAIPQRVGYEQRGTLPFVTEAVREPRGVHAVTLALELAAVAADLLGSPGGVDRRSAHTSAFLPTREEEDRAAGVLAVAGVPPETRPLVVHPGSGWPLKNWPAWRWGALARSLRLRYGVTPLVAGARQEERLVSSVVRASRRSAHGVTGLSVGELAALHRRAGLVVTTDSGALHLAAMLGAPIVGLYGPGDPVLARPWCDPARSRVVRVDLPCSPCGAMHDPPCGASREPACVMEISVQAVMEAAAELLEGRSLTGQGSPH